jgi:hypothetical protein
MDRKFDVTEETAPLILRKWAATVADLLEGVEKKLKILNISAHNRNRLD